jgi:hypothetical protein
LFLGSPTLIANVPVEVTLLLVALVTATAVVVLSCLMAQHMTGWDAWNHTVQPIIPGMSHIFFWLKMEDEYT